MGIVEWQKEGGTSDEQQDDGCCWMTSNIMGSEKECYIPHIKQGK